MAFESTAVALAGCARRSQGSLSLRPGGAGTHARRGAVEQQPFFPFPSCPWRVGAGLPFALRGRSLPCTRQTTTRGDTGLWPSGVFFRNYRAGPDEEPSRRKLKVTTALPFVSRPWLQRVRNSASALKAKTNDRRMIGARKLRNEHEKEDHSAADNYPDGGRSARADGQRDRFLNQHWRPALLLWPELLAPRLPMDLDSGLSLPWPLDSWAL